MEKVDVTPKEDGQIDPAQLLKATYDSGVTVAEMDVTARGKIVKDSSGNFALETSSNRSILPDFAVKDLRGRPMSSSDLRGKVVLIDFWATWCQPCKKEMPGYQKFADRYGQSGFVVIGFKLDTMADVEAPLAFARRLGIH